MVANDVDVGREEAVAVEGVPCDYAYSAVPWNRPDGDLKPRQEAIVMAL